MRLVPFLLLFLCLFLSGCTKMVPRAALPYPITDQRFGSQVKTVAIPLPVVASTPNEGITAGGLVAFLLHDQKDEVGTLVVPQVNYNRYFGTTTTLYGSFYPTPDIDWKLNLSQATRINKEYRLRYRHDNFLAERLELHLTGYDYADGSARFFGFEASSRRRNETNYAAWESGGNVTLGYRLRGTPWQLFVGERYRNVEIGRGAVPRVPFITDVFPDDSVPGVHGFSIHAQEIGVAYSTLDSPQLPTSGSYARFSVDNSWRILGSSNNFQTFRAEARGFFPYRQGRYVSVLRLVMSQLRGTDVPFLEQGILGGETTLRGYGQNRFIDRSYLLLNLEQRIRLARWEIFNVLAEWELAPFLDLGSVMRSLLHGRGASFRFNPGVGLRAVVRPNIIGRIDVGVGSEGPALFVGLGYPF